MKTNPQERSETFCHNFAKYLASTDSAHSAEDSIFQLRLAIMDTERAILVEEGEVDHHKRAPNEQYFHNRLQYNEMTEKLRAMETGIVELRLETLLVERALLEEELPNARKRKQIAASDTRIEFDRQTRLSQTLASRCTRFKADRDLKKTPLPLRPSGVGEM